MTALLALKNIKKRYDQHTVLNGVDITLHAGELVSLIGTSGCGKSTLLRIAAGLDNAFHGTVEVPGPEANDGRNPVGVVFQEPRLMPWLTVEENIGFKDGRADKAWIAQLIADVGLAGLQNSLPKKLSGGQAQRVAIARGLYSKPQILLMDEPFSAVDAFTRMHLQDLVAKLSRQYQIALLLVTHDLDEAFYLSDRVVILGGRPGQIVREFTVPLSRPRDRRNDLLAHFRAEALSVLTQLQV